MVQLVAIGLISILAQVSLLRELGVAFYGIELIYLLGLGVWLLSTGIGASFGRRCFARSQNRIRSAFILLAIVLPLDLAFIRSIRIIFAGVPGAYLPLTSQMAGLSISLMPIGWLLGILFQWAAIEFISERKTPSMAYAYESLGGLVGGVFATLSLHLGTRNLTVLLACSLITAAVAAVTVSGRPLFRLRLPEIALVVAFVGLIMASSNLDRWMTAWVHPHLEVTVDSPYGRLSVTNSAGMVTVFENDELSFTNQGVEAEEFTHLVMLHHSSPSRVLVLGGGMEGIIREVLKHEPQAVDYVELNPALLNLSKLSLFQAARQSFKERNVQVFQADPRAFLRSPKSYDLILVGMPEPASGQANRFYTVEFFEECKRKLRPGGILGLRLRSSENLWTPLLTRRISSIYASLKSVFGDVIVLPGTTNILIGSMDPILRDPEVPVARMRARKLSSDLISPAYIRYLYTNDRFSEIAETLQSGSSIPNRDARPVCYTYTALIWLAKFFPRLAFWESGTLPAFNSSQLWQLYGMLMILILLMRRFSGESRGILLMGLSGLIGMTLETILILYYQVKSGVLFQDLGILLTAFMGGLTAGAILSQRWMPPDRPFARRMFGIRIVLVGVITLICTITGVAIRANASGGLLQTGVLLFATGFFVSAVFVYIGSAGVKEPVSLVNRLYAADLLGSSLGCIVSGVFLIPFFGLFESTVALIGLIPLVVLLL